MAPISGDDAGDDRRGDDQIDHASLLDLSSELVQIAAPNGLLRYVNRTWRETLGYEEERHPLLILDVVHPDHERSLSETMRQVMQQPGATAFETVLVSRDGLAIPVAGQMECQRDGDTPVLIVSVMRDLRSELATSSALGDVRAQFQSAFESPAIGMAVQGLDGRWQAVNDALAEMLGYTPTEMLEMTFHDITHPDDLDRNVELLQRLMISDDKRFQMEKRYVHRDGGIVSVILTVSVVRGHDGKPVRFVSQVQDVTARRQFETQLLHRASHDVLTGLPNRALFMDRLEQAMARGQREDGQTVVMFLDLDGFKAVNDEFGHDHGDRLLVEIGRRLRACARAGDTVARLGGDEFTILLEQVRHPSVATEVAQRVRETLRYPVMLGENLATISPSIGIALSTGNDDTAEAILQAADSAMYAAKRAGKDRAVVAERGIR